MALDKVKQGVIADDAVGSSQIAPDTVVAADIGANAITASELADNAVDTAAIASNAVTTAKITDANITAAKLNTDVTDGSAITTEVKPHIIPGVLQPAVAGKDLSGTALGGSYVYGTAHTDGHKYYYTDIKGSKPIKDPRIGAHFGSQRHKFKSIQLLEQETATHGQEVYSIDGRKWCRVSSSAINGIVYDSNGHYLQLEVTGDFIEITGYFNDFNTIVYTHSNRANDVNIKINGGTARDNDIIAGKTSVLSPLRSRYVDTGSVINHGDTNVTSDLGTTPKINTLKIELTNISSEYLLIYGIELIAQDLSGSGSPNRSKIQIPSQDVVSYGKKFNISGTPHYNPFATKGDGSASTIPNNTTGDSVSSGWAGSTANHWDSSLDTATSLGLSAWESGGNYYRPVNGGRIIKWVDSSGNIKTSVNMMPPEAHSVNVADAGLNPPTGTHNWSTKYLPSFGNSLVGSDLAVNGDFSASTGWTLESGAWTISGGNLNASSAANASMTYRQVQGVITPGRKYKVLLTASAVTAGTFDVYVWGGGAPTVAGNAITSAGTSSVIFEGGDGTTLQYIAVRATGTSSGVFSSITMHEIFDADSQAEVAKLWHYREFGNGSANGNNTYKDTTILNPNESVVNLIYAMDDGLTSVTGFEVQTSSDGTFFPDGTDDWIYFTFIGTGLTLNQNGAVQGDYTATMAQNLPYGTHIFKITRKGSANASEYMIDGVDLGVVSGFAWGKMRDVTFHQPKKPPIPEDACILADYMLIADFVGEGSSSSASFSTISKGVRRCESSRDVRYDTSGSANIDVSVPAFYAGSRVEMVHGGGTPTVKLPFFGTNVVTTHREAGNEVKYFNIDATATSSAEIATTETNTFSSYNQRSQLNVTQTLGSHVLNGATDSGTNMVVQKFDVVSPIHTSSHYQAFETPYLHELIGGDRNMEQMNLVCTPDGKTWDELTRDTSYIGNHLVNTVGDVSSTDSDQINIFDNWRGQENSAGTDTIKPNWNKDFAIAYDRLICLKDGSYQIMSKTYEADGGVSKVVINGVLVAEHFTQAGSAPNILHTYLKRGDYVQIKGQYYSTGFRYNQYSIVKI